jgi:ribose transport system ATP-binding protein
MITSELPELLGVCDRIVIMHEGTLTGNLDRKDVTPELFMKYATGGM